jgi:nicotinamidase-related amidase
MLVSHDTVLVIVDVQGKLAQLMADRETLFANLQRMVRGAQVLDIPIIWVEQYPEKLGPTIPELTALLAGIEPIPKMSFSCAKNTRFNTTLSRLGKQQVLVVGMEAHVCVYQTAVDLVNEGYQVEVVEDAIGARIASNKGVGVRKMCAQGVGLTSTEMALFELMGDCEHPAFRDIQAIVK